MENLFNSVIAIQALLLEAGIPSIVIGGVAVGAWGEPRVTRDIDLKILLTRQDANRLLELVSTHSISLVANPLEMLRRQGMLFIQDNYGTRIDLLLAETPYDVEAVKRGMDVEIQPGKSIRICSPEDLIIYKLISTRQRDHEDAVSIVKRQGDALDSGYVLNWLNQFEQALDDSTLVAEFRKIRNLE